MFSRSNRTRTHSSPRSSVKWSPCRYGCQVRRFRIVRCYHIDPTAPPRASTALESGAKADEAHAPKGDEPRRASPPDRSTFEQARPDRPQADAYGETAPGQPGRSPRLSSIHWTCDRDAVVVRPLPVHLAVLMGLPNDDVGVAIPGQSSVSRTPRAERGIQPTAERRALVEVPTDERHSYRHAPTPARGTEQCSHSSSSRTSVIPRHSVGIEETRSDNGAEPT